VKQRLATSLSRSRVGVSQPIVTSPDDLDEERRQRRRIPELAIGLVLVLIGALTSLWLFASLSDSTEIVQSARVIRRGETITIDHLQAMRIGSEGSDLFVSRGAASELIGKVATFDIAAGTPLTMSMVDARPRLSTGEALASVALEPGQFPPDLAVGDVVAVALVPDIVVAEARPPRLFESSVTVWSIDQPEGLFGTAIVTLRTTPDLAVEITGSGGVHLAVVVP
jgi:hypothetical protein